MFVCAAVAVAVASAILFESAVYVPRKTGSLPEPVSRELRRVSASWDDVTVRASDGAVLRAWFLQPRRPSEGCVMLLHGIADSRQSGAGFADLLLDSGYAVLLADGRGHGESGGEQVSYGVREKGDLAVWARWMQAHGCHGLFALGESMGAGIALQAVGAGVPFRAVVAECPFASFALIAEYRIAAQMPGHEALARPLVRLLLPAAVMYGRLRYGVNLYDASPESAIRNSRTPILLIHGLRDDSIPPEHSRILAAADPKAELWLVPGAGHTSASSADPVEFRRRVLGFFSAHRGPELGELR